LTQKFQVHTCTIKAIPTYNKQHRPMQMKQAITIKTIQTQASTRALPLNLEFR